MPGYDLDDIRKNVIPVGMRVIYPSKDCMVVSKSGKSLTGGLPFNVATYIEDAINSFAFEKEFRENRDLPTAVVCHVKVKGLAFLREKPLQIFRDKDGYPFIGTGGSYKNMLLKYRREVMQNIELKLTDLPYRGDVNIQCVFYCGKVAKLPRLTDLLNTAIDLLVTCGIIGSDRQIVGFSGTKIVRGSKHEAGVDLIVRAF